MTLALAMMLDALLGEPKWLWSRLPHPAVLMGRLIGWFDKVLNRGDSRRMKGVTVVIWICTIAAVVGTVPRLLPFGIVLEVVLAAILIAQKSLVEHVQAVADGLRQSLDDGKAAVAMIVGRDVSEMDAPSVARGAIESAAENFSDGVIAPVFWFLIAGLPGMLVYKMVNTADSMIGYRTERHERFGWAAARLDDVLNWVPARITAVLISGLTWTLRQWRSIARDARKHRSPNAGWPEAAMARALDVALAGPRSYDGKMLEYPFVNDAGRKDVAASDIDASTRILWLAWAAALLTVILISMMR